MALGPTRWSWVRPVRENINRVTRRWPSVTANTYVGHPWRGWGRWSVDFWGPGGRGDALVGDRAEEIRRYLMALNGPPYIRHTILDHTLWTSFGGASTWAADDHTGNLRHLHVTYWRG